MGREVGLAEGAKGWAGGWAGPAVCWARSAVAGTVGRVDALRRQHPLLHL